MEETLMIQPGDILLIRGNTWIDQIIRRITGSSYTHVAGIINSNEVVEILPFKKTGFRRLKSFAGRADIFTCNTLTVAQRRIILNHILEKVGTKYDYNLLFWEASRYLFHWKWPYKARKSLLCSTLWSDAYRKAGVDLCPDILYPSPGDLENSPLLQKIRSY